MNDIHAIHKITANKTILFSKTKQSWLLDETKGGTLSKLIVGFTPPADTTIYTLENKNFWLLSKTSLSFPSTIAAPEIGQINLVSLSPDLLKDPSNVNRVLFAGPQRFILANDKKANIIMLDGDKARIVAFDFPKVNELILPVYSAGLMFGNGDAYWFLSKDNLLILKKNPDNIWNWFISKYKLDAQGVPPDAILEQVAMLIELGNDKNIFYTGRTYEIVAGKLYEQNAIKLSLDEALPVTIDPLFTSNIQPILKNNCVSCHPGYDDLSIVKTKIDAYILLVGNLSMPKNSAILEPQLTKLKDYLAKLKAGN